MSRVVRILAVAVRQWQWQEYTIASSMYYSNKQSAGQCVWCAGVLGPAAQNVVCVSGES